MAVNIFCFIILILLLLIIAILSVNLNIVISFYVSNEYDKLYKYAIRMTSLFRYDSSTKKKKKKKNFFIKEITKRLLNSTKSYKQYIEIHNISFTGQISFGDAYNTAMASGLLSGFAGAFVGILSTYANKISVSRINICPVYEEKISAELLFECIVSANAGNIIVESLKILKGSSKNDKSH